MYIISSDIFIMNIHSAVTSEFPSAPVRHMKILSKLARCRICSRLLCCIEHRITHEKSHYLENASHSGTARSNSSSHRKNLNSSNVKRDWLSVSDPGFALCLKKSNFPLVCVVCKITIASAHHLTSIIKNGPQCSSKNSHWIISVKKYIVNRWKSDLFTTDGSEKTPKRVEENNSSKNIEITKSTPIFSHQNSLYSTPQEKFLSQFHLKSFNMSQKNPLSLGQSFCTSTPQDSNEHNEDEPKHCVAFTPKWEQNMPGILCSSAEDQKSRGSSLRRVTFSNELQTYIENESKYSSKRKNKNDQHSSLSGNKSENMKSNDVNSSDKMRSNAIEKDNRSDPLTKASKANESNTDGTENIMNYTQLISKDSFISGGKSELPKQEKREGKQEIATHINQEIEKEESNIEENLMQEERENREDNLVNVKNQETDSIEHSQEAEDCNSEIDKFGDEEIKQESVISDTAEGRSSVEDETAFAENNESDELFYSGVELLVENEGKSTNVFDDTASNVNNVFSVRSTIQTDNDDTILEHNKQIADDSYNCDSTSDGCDDSVPKLNLCLSNSSLEEGLGQGPSKLNFTNESLECIGTNNINGSFSSSPEQSLYSSEKLEPLSCSLPNTSFDEASRNISITEEDSNLKKIATVFSSSWTRAKIFLSTSFGGKRDNMEISEDDLENKIPKKKIRLLPSSPEGHNFSGRWKSYRKAHYLYNYQVKGRRPLSRMKKSK